MRNFKKAISLLLCIALVLSTMLCGGVVFADTTEQSESLISGTEPMAFMAVGDGAKAFDWTTMRGANAEHGWYGYDKTSAHGTYGNGGSAYNQWKPYMAMITDGNTTDSFLVRGQETSKDVLIAFELADEFSLNGFKIYGVSGTVDVYASDTYATLFDTVSTTVTASEDSASASLSVESAKFVGFRLNACNCYIKEIEVYGGEPISAPVITDPNIAQGLMPFAFMAVPDGANTRTKDTKLRGPVKGNHNWDDNGYDLTLGDKYYSVDRFNALKDAVAILTDGSKNADDYILIRPQTDGNDVIIAYEVPKADISKITITGVNCDSVDIYASSAYETLFDADSKTVIPNNGNATTDIDAKEITFVAFRLNNSNSSMSEIEIFGIVSDDSKDESLLLNKNPSALYVVDDGNSTFAKRQIWFSEEASNLYGYGQGKPETMPSDYEVISKLNDGDYSTNAYIRNSEGQSDDVLFVYKLDDVTEITEISFTTSLNNNDVEFYLSKSYASLFNDKNLVNNELKKIFEDGGIKQLAVLEEPKEAVYIGLVFRLNFNAGITISEIDAKGNLKQANIDTNVIGDFALTNTNANEKTKAFYQYLYGVGKSDKVLLGAHIKSEADRLIDLTDENNYYSYLEQRYGLSPAIYSINCNEFNTESIDLYKQYYTQGSVPMISCLFAYGLPAFVDYRTEKNDEYITNYMIKYLDKNYTPQSSILPWGENDDEQLVETARTQFWSEVEKIADFFEELEKAGVETYMVSPFSEMNIHGFFGDKNHTDAIDSFKTVWQQVYDYFVNERKLKGIIMVFRPSAITTEYTVSPMEYYPGDNYVDVIAPTVYSNTSDGVLPEIEDYDELIATGKPFALSETGLISSYNVENANADCLNLLNSLKTTYNEAAFVSLWYGRNYNIARHQNSIEFINDEYILTVESMKDYRNSNITGLKLYSDNDYSGDSVFAYCGEYNVSDYNDLVINSFDMEGNYKITFYSGVNCTGDTHVFGKSIANVDSLDFDYQSFKIEYTDEYILFDVNSDDLIDIRDLVAIKKLQAGISDIRFNELAADINSDGLSNAYDNIEMRKYLLNNF